MESSLRYNKRRSGYEPSDTETEWHDSPNRENNGHDQSRRLQIGSPARTRHSSKSPCRPHGQNGNFDHPDLLLNVSSLPRRAYSDIRRKVSPLSMSQRRTTNPDNNGGGTCQFSKSERRINNPDNNNTDNTTPFSVSERRRYASPYKPVGEGNGVQGNHDVSWRSSYSRRAASAPRARLREKQKQENGRASVGVINEMVATAKITSMPNNFDSMDSISPGDIFFSRDYYAVEYPKNGSAEAVTSLPKPPGLVGKKEGSHETQKVNVKMPQTTINSSSLVSRQSSTVSESSGRTSASTTRFVASRRKSQSDTWFSCINKGYCKKSNKSPERERAFDEASFIGKAVVVESLRPLWADKHQPVSLVGFTCHKNETQLLQKLANSEMYPHILLKGPPGTGKKALIMALLREIYGDPVWNISHDLRYFHILESRPMKVVVPVSSSPHHVELNVYLESKASYALTALVKQISSEYAVTPEISVAPTKADYKVLVLYDVDKAVENIQHLIKWIMDCYSHSCKLILCCEDDVDILDSVKSRCKVINVEAPSTNEELAYDLLEDLDPLLCIKTYNIGFCGPSVSLIAPGAAFYVMEVLIQIAKKEGFELSTSFAAKIASKSKQNLRRAIMALESCKLHNYPFAEDQPIPLGWEEAVVELAAHILAEPFPNRLFIVRGKIQKLLGDFVHPKLILLKLVEQFLRGVDANLKREIYYWYAYYDKRLPSGTNALLKLEEFVAKLMSIYRKSSSRQSS